MGGLAGCLLDSLDCLLYEVFIFYGDLYSIVWAVFCTASTDTTVFFYGCFSIF